MGHRKPFLCPLARATRQDRRCPAGRSAEITHATFRRACPLSGKGAWITAEQRRFSVAAAAPPQLRTGRGRPVRPELAPECLAVRRPPGNGCPRPPRSVACALPPRQLPGFSSAAPGRHGEEGGVRAGPWRRVLGIGGGDRKVDGGGDANGEEPGRWMPRVGTFCGSHPNLIL